MAQAEDHGFEKFERFLDEWSRRDFLRRSGGALAFSAFMAGGLEAVLAACGGGQGTTTGPAKKGGHVVEGSTSDPTTFNPIFSSDTASLIPLEMMFEPLLKAGANGDLIPALAKSMPKTPSDGLTYKFDLRQDVKWSDGQPLTAEDAVFTLKVMGAGNEYNYKAINSRHYPTAEQYIESATAPDKYTLIVKTKTVYAPFLISPFCTRGILPKHVLDSIAKTAPGDFRKADFNFAPNVVSGPFTLGKWDKTQQVVLNANPSHYAGRPNLDTYVIKNVGTAQAIVNQLKTGELDVGDITPSLWDDLATARDRVDRRSFQSASYDYFAYNMDPANKQRPISGKIFGDPATGKQVRQALYYAIDRQKIADRIYFKQADVAFSPEYKVLDFYLTDQVMKYPLDPKKAADMLDQAGWKPGPDGVRTKDGVRLSFEIITNVGNTTREATIQVLSESWRQIGVEAKPKAIQFTEYVKTSTTREFDMVMGGIVDSGIPDPDLRSVYHSQSIGKDLNRMGYSNPRVDSLLDQGLQTLDRNKRKQIYAELQKILTEDVPAAMLVWPRSLRGVSKRVQNFNFGPFHRYQRPWIKDVWVTDGK